MPGDRRRLRASDRDREAVAERLRVAHNEGRLELAEYDQRLQRVYTAQTYGDLDALIGDLPAPPPPPPNLPVAVPAPSAGRWRRALPLLAVAGVVFGPAIIAQDPSWMGFGIPLALFIFAIVGMATVVKNISKK